MVPEGLGLNNSNKAARLVLDCGLMNFTDKREKVRKRLRHTAQLAKTTMMIEPDMTTQ